MTIEFSEQSIIHVEGLLAGWNDASIRTTTSPPARYLQHQDSTSSWKRGYNAGREAFMTAWEKGALGGTRFRLVSREDERYWRLPFSAEPEQPAALLIDSKGEVILTISPAVEDSSNHCYSIFSGELRVAQVTGDLLGAMQAAACYVR